ncbi:LAMI_0F13498g1_1 [Lachancea mirantina]|uniref:Peroxisome assembly protein 22 n=1 Tax=Lachancea mirantina TaxID=1230905 RepID=A0A1G4K3D0_9SACH|nr:LAMI_0F13498g1_1 [Lachancea mirantina]
MSRKTTSRVKWALAGLGAVATLFTYLYLTRERDETGTETDTDQLKSSAHRVILVTETVFKDYEKWRGELQNGCVLVIPPNRDYDSVLKLENPKYESQIIKCDSMTGVWAVVRHLRKPLTLASEDLDMIPDELSRFVGEIIEFTRHER